jgi:hypothetical protein
MQTLPWFLFSSESIAKTLCEEMAFLEDLHRGLLTDNQPGALTSPFVCSVSKLQHGHFVALDFHHRIGEV